MAADDPRPDLLVLPDDELAAVRHLADAARAADAAYRLAAARVVLYEFLHQYGRSDLPAFKVALDLASSLRKIIDDLGDEEAGPLVMPLDELGLVKWLQDTLAEAIGPACGLAAVGRALEAVTPVVEHAARAAAGSHEGIRLWMLDCGSLVQKHREHAVEASARLGAAGAKLSAIEAHCRTHPELAGAGYPQLASDILVIIGAGEPQERSDDKEGRRP